MGVASLFVISKATAPLLLVVLTVLIEGATAQYCTIVNDCNGRASSVAYVSGSCICSGCRNQWTGNQCQLCPQQYDPSQDCGACNTANLFAGVYPSCPSIQCSQANCNNRASFISGNTTGGCKCYCINQYYGSQCQSCPAGIDPAQSCGACLSGYTGYPNCQLMCTNGANCSGHAAGVYGTSQTGCFCQCLNYWSGVSCSSCPPFMDTSSLSQCGACLSGYDNPPNCSLSCTSLANCSNHASSVSGNSATGCVCKCRSSWFGPTCSSCPTGYDATASGDCATCATGYSAPNCSLTCTMANCSNHAASVTGTSLSGCACTCRSYWRGADCSVCPAGFNASNDCSGCLSGYSNPPNCSRSCTDVADCSNHSLSVSGTTFTGCVCNCRNGYAKPNCSVCPAPFVGPDCDLCPTGYTGVPPVCNKICDITIDCGSGASDVKSNGTQCICICRNQYSGRRCDTCSSMFSGDCDVCNANGGNFPSYEFWNTSCTGSVSAPYCTCALVCDTQYNCSGHAYYVTGDGVTGCSCACTNKWNSTTCSDCPMIYDPTKNCNACNAGYDPTTFPTCLRLCTVALDCNNRASSVTGSVGSCVCTCLNSWTGANCSVCPPKYSTPSYCSQCATGYDTYPQCFLSCTAANCSNHSLSVTGNTNTSCVCTCRNLWNGTNCSTCPPFVNASADCGACITGYGGYPNCIPICNSTNDCNNHANIVTGLQ